VRVVEQAIEQRGDGGGVAEELAPVFHRTVRGDQRRGALVATLRGRSLEEVWRIRDACIAALGAGEYSAA